jgi:hypothetical protein
MSEEEAEAAARVSEIRNAIKDMGYNNGESASLALATAMLLLARAMDRNTQSNFPGRK